MADQDPRGMLNDACLVARKAGATALDRRGALTVTRKADASCVTDADHAIQALILDMVAARYPHHAVLAEEKVDEPGRHADLANARYVWVIDPLDGTRNYAAGLPCFSTSIAVLDAGRPAAAVVREHNLAHEYTALPGQGAWLNGEPVRATDDTLERDYIVGVESSKNALTVGVLREWTATPGLVLRNLGSTAVHMALVAAGALDAAFGKRTKIWDVAAGTLLATEAGARVTDPWGRPRVPLPLGQDPQRDVPYLAGRADLHERLRRSIEQISAGARRR